MIQNWLQRPWVGHTLWFLGIGLFYLICMQPTAIELPLFEWIESELGPSLIFLPILSVGACFWIIPIGLGIRTIKRFRAQLSDTSGHRRIFFQELIIGGLLVIVPCLVSFVLLRSIGSGNLLQFVVGFISLLGAYCWAVVISSAMRTIKGMWLLNILCALSGSILEAMFLFRGWGYAALILSLILMLGIPLSALSVTWQHKRGFVGLPSISRPLRKALRRRPRLLKNVPTDVLFAWVLWVFFAILLPLLAYARVRAEFSHPSEPYSEWPISLLWLEPVQFFRQTAIWWDAANIVLAAWLGVTVGRFSRIKRASAFFLPVSSNQRRRLVFNTILTGAACAILALIPASLIVHAVDNWMQLALPRPTQANATWIPDLNMLLAKGDAILLRRYSAPGTLGTFAVGFLIGWMTRYRSLSIIVTLVFSTWAFRMADAGYPLEVTGVQLTIGNDPHWIGYVRNVAVLTGLLLLAAILLINWHWRPNARLLAAEITKV